MQEKIQKPVLEVIEATKHWSVRFKIDRDIWPVYHHHPEYDIFYFLKDSGTIQIGNWSGNFKKGSIFIIGPELPHGLQSDFPDDQDESNPALAVLQFTRESIGLEFLNKPETKHIKEFLTQAQRGIEFHGKDRELIAKYILELRGKNKLNLFTRFIDILDLMANSEDITYLTQPRQNEQKISKAHQKLIDSINFMNTHFKQELLLEDLADHLSQNSKSISRFIKQKTGRNFSELLNEIRISHACQMIMTTDIPLSKLYSSCGYKNRSNFNRWFLKLRGCTPKDFKHNITTGYHTYKPCIVTEDTTIPLG